MRTDWDVENGDGAGHRDPMPTIIDEAATEEARIASVLMDSSPPPGTGDAELVRLRAALEPMTRVPVLVRPMTQLGDVIDDPKTAYVLGFVDGLLPLETIVDVAGLPELDTLSILGRAITGGVITFQRDPV